MKLRQAKKIVDSRNWLRVRYSNRSFLRAVHRVWKHRLNNYEGRKAYRETIIAQNAVFEANDPVYPGRKGDNFNDA
jgi:hypothetical protein